MTGVVGVLMARSARLMVICQDCGLMEDASLETIVAAKGLDFDLTNRHPPCRADGCDYWMSFYVQDGMGMRSLTTPDDDRRQSDRRTRWIGRGRKNQKPPPRERQGP